MYEKHAKVFKALCDENRLLILEMLRNGDQCACDLLENIDIGQSSLSYHMKILVESGIVESQKEGKWTRYKISNEGSAKAMELLKAITTINATAQHCSCKK